MALGAGHRHGSAALLVLGPLLLLLALLIYLEGGSPIVFRQKGIGHDRLPFTVDKFRTMFTRAATADGSLYTADDPRITHPDRSRCKLCLDELSQLWNVLQGHMSLIGPCVEWDWLIGKYEAIIRFITSATSSNPASLAWAQVR